MTIQERNMKYVLFLNDLDLSRNETRDLLHRSVGDKYEAIWHGDPKLKRLRNDVEILVTAEHEVDSTVLERWPELKMVSLAFTGYDRVDTGYCRSRGLSLYYVPDYSSNSVAELTVGLAISVLRKIPSGDESTRKGRWDRKGIRPGIELYGKRVAILGTGNIGARSAKLFLAFGCTVVGWSKSEREDLKGFGLKYEENLEKIFSDSDIIVLHLPVVSDGQNGQKVTKHIVGAKLLDLMKPTSVLINTARSELVDTKALIRILKRGQILGAGIDVFDHEPASRKNALMALDNVVLTPHLGFKTREALRRLAETAIDNIGRFVDGNNENSLK